jgi:hypothetical protein
MWPPTKHRWLKFDVQYVVTTLIALCALGVAGTTAYFTTLRVVDDVRVITGGAPILLSKENNKVSVWRRNQFTFINAGTRSVAVNSIYLYLAQRAKEANFDKANCATDASVAFYDMEPFVIKAGDIIAKRIFLSLLEDGKQTSPEDYPDVLFDVKKELIKAKSLWYRICILVDFSTPDEDHSGKELVEYIGDAKDDSFFADDFQETRSRPIQLLYNSNFVLWPHRD